jgi:hypothetical protein
MIEKNNNRNNVLNRKFDFLTIEDIVNAIGTISIKDGNSFMPTTKYIKNQVTVYVKDKALRVKAPELKECLEGFADEIII